MRRIAIASGIALAAIAFLVWLSGREGAQATSEPAPALPVAALAVALESGYLVSETYAGRVLARRSSALGFERAGRLEQVLADAGDRVEAGALLAALDRRALAAERREAEARVREIEARLALASRTTGRRQALRASDHVSIESLDQAVFSEASLAAELAAARAGLESIAVALDLSEIRAPYAGSITARHADEGTVVTPGQPILDLIEDGALEAHVGVPAAAAAALAPGSRHELEVEGRRHPAVLQAVLADVETETRTVTAIFRLEPGEAAPLDGALARLALQRRIETPGFWLPIGALAESHRGLWSVYALEADPERGGERIARRQLELLHAEAERAFVRGTLADGDRVVVGGLHRLVPGQRVAASGAPAPGAAQ